MTLQDFIIESKAEVEAYLRNCGMDDLRINDVEVVKTNDTILHALTIGKSYGDTSMVGANVYVDDLFERFNSGCDRGEVMDELKSRCRTAAGYALPPMPDHNSFSLENINTRLTVRLLDVRSNHAYMKDRPYIDAGNGLVMVVQINAEESICSEWLITVNNSLLETIGCSRDELLTMALANTIRMEPPVMMRLKDFVFEDEQVNLFEAPDAEKEEKDLTYLLTNKSRFKGASVLFYPGVMEKVADILGGGYCVLPSSIHEMIIIPDSMRMPVGAMVEMLKNGNSSYVDKDEYLSDRVLHYDPNEGCLRIASNGAGDLRYDDDFPEGAAMQTGGWQADSAAIHSGTHIAAYA